MYKQILVPLDGSRFSEAALPVALGIAQHTRASVHLVTVQEPIPSFAYAEWETAAEEWSAQYLANAASRCRSRTEVVVTSSLVSGRVAEMLESEARDHDTDLVVMASHGRGALTRAWLGSVTDAFVRQTSHPILVVRPEDVSDDAIEEMPTHEFSSILVPLDGSALAETVLDHAVDFGELYGARYHLLRIVPYPIDISSPYLPHTVQMNMDLVEDAKRAAESYLEERAAVLRERDLQVDIGVLVDTQPGHGILNEAEARGCDLIAMATHARKGLTRAILGSTADKVLRGSHIPLLLYHPPEPS
ncbi:MAG: universal stress protein [Gemmatimonadota bacterium]|nr:universal stress protein [Gemmatimonadota bacterium]MDH5759246.1 universal stress protein [Gemmatimonadota bacterium]